MLVANGEHHNLCRPRHTICLQLIPIAYVHPDIKSYPSVNASSSCPFFSPSLLPLSRHPLPVAPLPISPFKLPPLHLPLPVSSPLSQSCLPLTTPLLLVHSPASLFPSHSWPLPDLLHLPLLLLIAPVPISSSQSLPSPHPSLPLPVSLPPSPGSLLAPQSRHATTVIEFLLIYSSKTTFEANGTKPTFIIRRFYIYPPNFSPLGLAVWPSIGEQINR